MLLPRVLDGALALTGADFGNIQLLDPVTGSLRIVTQSGFSSEFLEYFAVVDDTYSACGRAAQAGAQAVIADVTADPGFAPHRDIAAASGFRAVQCTPLADYAGRLIGMVLTHFRHPYRPPARDLKIMELYDFACEAVARNLGVPAGDGPGDPVGFAVISALLDPGDGHKPGATIPPEHGDARGRPVGRSASLENAMSQFAGDIVHRLFSVGLSLESARSIVGKGPAGDRVAAATDELDRLISIHPSVEAAVGAAPPETVISLAQWRASRRDDDQAGSGRAARWRAAGPRDGRLAAGITPAVVWGLVDGLADGVVLADGDGMLVLANRRAEEMFGYPHGELAGRPVELLIPARVRAAHMRFRAGCAKEPAARPMGARARLAGLRQDGTMFPVRVSLSPVPTATGGLIMAVIRDITGEQPRADLAELARVAAVTEQARRGQELLDRVVDALFHVGLSLQAASDLPHKAAMQQIADALGRLDDTIRQIHDQAFANQHSQGRTGPAPRNGSE